MEQWKAATPNHHTWKVKYYKGLGTSTSKEAKEYFSDMARHRIPFKYSGSDDDRAIELVCESLCEYLVYCNLPHFILYANNLLRISLHKNF